LQYKRSYLGALLDGTKKNPGDWYLRKLGVRRVTYDLPESRVATASITGPKVASIDWLIE
jgi:hypothetical protein